MSYSESKTIDMPWIGVICQFSSKSVPTLVFMKNELTAHNHFTLGATNSEKRAVTLALLMCNEIKHYVYTKSNHVTLFKMTRLLYFKTLVIAQMEKPPMKARLCQEPRLVLLGIQDAPCVVTALACSDCACLLQTRGLEIIR